MTGAVDWSVLIFVVTVFGGGATLAWFFSSTISKQNETFEAKIDSTIKAQNESIDKKIDGAIDALTDRMDGLDVISKSDRVQLMTKLEAFDDRDRKEHKEMIETITQIRLDLAAARPKGRGKK